MTDAGTALLREAGRLVDALDSAVRQRLGARDHRVDRLLTVLEDHVGDG
ncbi:hypothetical protein [Micromonospora sp. NPDC049497]